MTFLESTNPVVTVSGGAPILSTGGPTPVISIEDSTTDQKGAVQLEDSYTSSSITMAATSKSVKEAYDRSTTISGSLQTNIDGKSDTDHIHDDRYYTEDEVDVLISTISGGTGVSDHSELNNLDYVSSGHTGFQPSGDYLTDSEFSTYSGTLQSQIDGKSDTSHFHDGLYYTESEVDTISGSLQTNIDGKSATDHIHDDRYYTEDEVDTISGSLQTNIDGKSDTAHIHDNRYYTESEVDTISGTLQTNIDNKAGTFLDLTDTPEAYDANKYLMSTNVGTEWSTVSGGTGTSIHPELSNLDYASSGHTGFQPAGDYLTDSEFSTYSGTLQDNIDGKSDTAHIHDDRYYTESEVDTVSGSLQTNIDGKSDINHLHDDRYYTESEVDTISGSLNSDIEYVTNITNYTDSPMIVTGGEISKGTNAGTFKVGALTALIRTTDSSIGELAYVTKPEEDNIEIPLVDTLYYVVVNYNGGSPTVGIIGSLQNFNDNIPIGSVMKDGLNEVNYISGCFRLQNGVAKLHYRAFELEQLKLASGNNIAYSGINNFTMTVGVIYEGINRLTQDIYDSAVSSFQYVYNDGDSGWATASGNAIDFLHYDDGDGTLGDVGVSKYSCHWVYRHVDDGNVYVLYGRESYSFAEAEASQVPTGPDHLTDFGCLIGRIIVPQSGGSFASIQMVTDTVFTGASVATHNDLGGLNAGDYRHLTASEYGSTILNRSIPGNIGGTTPGSGGFTALTASTDPVDEHGVGDRDFNDNRYYIQSEVDTISGSLQTNIDNKADIVHIHDDRYYTESEIDTISGSLQTNIDGKPDTLLELTDTPAVYEVNKYLRSTTSGTEWSTVSGVGAGSSDHAELSNLDYAVSGHVGFASSTDLVTISGTLQTNIDNKVNTFIELPDTPNTYDIDKYLRSTVDGTEWSTMTFTSLIDTPATYSGHSGQYLKVASNEVELEYTDISSGTATTTISGWSVYDETTYYSDFEHNLSTNEISVFIVDTTTNKEVGVEDIEVINTDTVRIYVVDNTCSLKVSVITGGLVNTCHTHNVIEVGKSGAEYTSVKDALDSITDSNVFNRYTVLIGPGIFIEDNPIQLKPWVSLKSIATKEVTMIAPQDVNSDLLTGCDRAYISNMVLTGVASGKALSFEDTGLITVKDIILVDNEYGIHVNNADAYIEVHNLYAQTYAGTIKEVLTVVSGTAQIRGVTVVEDSIVETIIKSDAGNISAFNVWSESTNLTNGLVVDNGGELLAFSGRISNATNGLHIGSNGGKIEVSSVVVENSSSYDLLIESSSGIFVGSGCSLNRDKLSIATGASINNFGYDKYANVERILGEFAVGRDGLGSASRFGEGGSYEHSVKVKTFDGSNYHTLTTQSGIFFPNTISGTCIYIGNDSIFYGLKYALTSGMVPGTGSVVCEYYDGNGSWLAFNTQNTIEHYSDIIAPFTVPDESYTLRFDQNINTGIYESDVTASGIVQTSVDGVNGYWIRGRIVDNITSSHEFTSIRLKGNYTIIRSNGSRAYHGEARVEEIKELVIGATSAGTANESLSISPNILFPYTQNEMATTGSDEAVYSRFIIPPDCDLSCGLLYTYEVTNKVSPASDGIVHLTVTMAGITGNDKFDGTINEYVVDDSTFTVSATDIAWKIWRTTSNSRFDLSSFVPGDVIYCKLHRPNDAPDTYASSMCLSNQYMEYRSWQDGISNKYA